MKYIIVYLVISICLDGNFAYGQIFKEKVENYNKNATDVNNCFNNNLDKNDKKIIKNIIESNKITRLPIIKNDGPNYLFDDQEMKILFTEKSMKENQITFNGFQIKFPEKYSVKTIKETMDKVTSKPYIADKSTLFISCFLGPSVSSTIPTPTPSVNNDMDEKISEYNQNSKNMEILPSIINDPADKEFYAQILETDNSVKLPPITQKGDYYQMQYNDIILEFTKEMIKEGKIRINGEIVDISTARNAKELSELIQQAKSKL